MDSEYIVDVILPKREVHLLAGPSGSGKTRWLLPSLLKWEEGETFLGYQSYPVPWVYIAADRKSASVSRTLASMGIDPKRIKTINAWQDHMNENVILDRLQRSPAKLAVWEAFGSFVQHPQTSTNVKNWLQRVSCFCDEFNKTIIAVVESPKQKPYEKYENPRQRVSGAAAWGHFAETIFLVEPEKPGDSNNTRRSLFLCPRNAPELKLTLSFDTYGHLVADPTRNLLNFGATL